MEVKSRHFREIESIQLSECISTVSTGKENFAAGCLDDNIYMWNTVELLNSDKDALFAKGGNSLGIVDLKFNPSNTILAVSCLDSTLKLWDLATREQTSIECQVMQNWKIEYIGNNIVTCGDQGRVSFYDTTSQERVHKLQTGDIFLTSMAKSHDEAMLATANNIGQVFIVNLINKNKVASFRPHFKIARGLSFTEDGSKLLSCSDDYSIKMIDIASEKVVSTLEGHKEAVSCVVCDPNQSKVVYSSSFDKSVKYWDLRTKGSIGSALTGSSLWCCQVLGKNVIAGGENGMLSIFSVE